MIFSWIARLFRRMRRQPPGVRHLSWPTREQIEALPSFEALDLDDIVEIVTDHGAQRAYKELINAGVVGFDTESKPTFVKGHVSTGPHVAQFATTERAYIFLLNHEESRKVVCSLIASKTLKKVGFGLNEDLRRIPIKLKVQPQSVLDLEKLFAARGYGRGVGVKVGVAIALKRRFKKSKKASTSNWTRRPLTASQLLYAANDAYAPVRVFHALGAPNRFVS